MLPPRFILGPNFVALFTFLVNFRVRLWPRSAFGKEATTLRNRRSSFVPHLSFAGVRNRSF